MFIAWFEWVKLIWAADVHVDILCGVWCLWWHLTKYVAQQTDGTFVAHFKSDIRREIMSVLITWKAKPNVLYSVSCVLLHLIKTFTSLNQFMYTVSSRFIMVFSCISNRGKYLRFHVSFSRPLIYEPGLTGLLSSFEAEVQQKGCWQESQNCLWKKVSLEWILNC